MRELPAEVELCVRLRDGHRCLGRLTRNLAGAYCYTCSATERGAIYRLAYDPTTKSATVENR